MEFKNCTGDTLIIGHSYFDAIDSVHCQILPAYDIPGIEELDSIKQRIIFTRYNGSLPGFNML